MDEDAILELLALAVRQAGAERGVEALLTPGLAEDIADSAWIALLIFLREGLLQDAEVSLAELGTFRHQEGAWEFQPAASLVEAVSLRQDREQGQVTIARAALFYTAQAASLLAKVVHDIDLETADDGVTPEERLLETLFGARARSSSTSFFAALSNDIRALLEQSDRLRRIAAASAARSETAQQQAATLEPGSRQTRGWRTGPVGSFE